MLYHKIIQNIFLFNILLVFCSTAVSQNVVSSKFPDLKKFNLETDQTYDLNGKILLIDLKMP